MSLIPEGWNEHALGWAKWFGDHWKFAPDAKEAARLDAEVALRTDGATQQASNDAAELRATADVVDPAVDTAPAPETTVSPEPTSAVATATVVPSVEELREAALAAPPEEAPAETPAPEVPVAEPTPTGGA